MKLDLQKDFELAFDYIAERIKQYEPSTDLGLGDAKYPVRSIQFYFDCEVIGYILLVFDRRPDAEPDGEWGKHTNADGKQFPHFEECASAFEDGFIEILSLNGELFKLTDCDKDWQRYVDLIGDTFKAAMFKARDEGLFELLPKSDRCEFGIESCDGAYGWPIYEDRLKDNLV